MFNPRRLDALIRSALTEDQIEIHLEQLVSGLEHDFYFFHILGTILPLEFNIFQRGRSTTNQKSYTEVLGISYDKFTCATISNLLTSGNEQWISDVWCVEIAYHE